MKNSFALFLISLISLWAVLPANAVDETATVAPVPVTSYQLGPGDVLRITVFGERELSFESVRLNDEGAFSYPFLGQVNAKGISATELERKLREGLMAGYLVDPRVTVGVLEYRPFFISGEVKNSGGYVFQPGLTIRRAVALAGGLTPRASERRMSIVRETDTTKTPQPVTMDSLVQPGDTITIDQGFF